jgi:hypothetical protein
MPRNENPVLKNIRNAKAILKRLGSADAIAEFFRRNGIRATQATFTCTACPVAEYLKRRGIDRPEVTQEYFDAFVDGHRRTFSLPEIVGDFIRKFDAGSYDFLNAPAVPA